MPGALGRRGDDRGSTATPGRSDGVARRCSTPVSSSLYLPQRPVLRRRTTSRSQPLPRPSTAAASSPTRTRPPGCPAHLSTSCQPSCRVLDYTPRSRRRARRAARTRPPEGQPRVRTI
ncbi:hypothetical protein HBB16_18800 [Pseudonocardia sp. MCCB 268]|nr:hypothetical protein [Pseudonocardia cytotoxica]